MSVYVFMRFAAFCGNELHMLFNRTSSDQFQVQQPPPPDPPASRHSLLCSNPADLTMCVSLSKPHVSFRRRNVLSISSGIEDIGPLKWDLALCLLAVWIICFFCIWKGVKSTGKVSAALPQAPRQTHPVHIMLPEGCLAFALCFFFTPGDLVTKHGCREQSRPLARQVVWLI